MTQATATEWPWPWHPDIHWYYPHLNLSSVGPEIWDGLHLGVLLQLLRYNDSHPAAKWIAGIVPNITAWNKLYYEEYEGTGRNMLVCIPQVVGKYPEWYKGDRIWGCGNYTPELAAHNYRRKDFSFVYNREKPMVDVSIGIAAVVTTLGIPGVYSIYFYALHKFLL